MKYAIIIILLLLYNIVTATKANNSGGDDCLLLVRKAYQKMNEISKAPEGKVYYLNVSVKTVMNENFGGIENISNMEVYASYDKNYLISKDMEIYQDQKYSVSVFPAKKMIYVSNNPTEGKNQKINHLLLVQDSIFNYCYVKKCNEVNFMGNKGYKKVKLELNSDGKKLYSVNSVTFYVDTQNELVRKIEIYYLQNYKISNIVMTINKLDLNHVSNKLNKPVLALIYNSNHQLLQKYQDYKLVDARAIDR